MIVGAFGIRGIGVRQLDYGIRGGKVVSITPNETLLRYRKPALGTQLNGNSR
jgi:hypothetical protein